MKAAKPAPKTGKTARCITDQKTPLLDALLDEVQAFCAARRGRVVALADALGVVQPQASAWLARRFVPSGEATLQIQAWLAREREAERAEIEARAEAAPARLAGVIRRAGYDSRQRTAAKAEELEVKP